MLCRCPHSTIIVFYVKHYKKLSDCQYYSREVQQSKGSIGDAHRKHVWSAVRSPKELSLRKVEEGEPCNRNGHNYRSKRSIEASDPDGLDDICIVDCKIYRSKLKQLVCLFLSVLQVSFLEKMAEDKRRKL